MILASVLGVLIGLTLGLTGAGGGILAVPALVVGLGFNMAQATPIALMAVGLAALVGGLDGFRRGMVRYKAAILMSLVGAAISPLGVMAAHHLPNAWLMTLFSGVMFLVALRMYRQVANHGATAFSALDGRRETKACMLSSDTGKFIWNRKSATTIGAIGAISGLFTGMLGVGGGFVIVPALRQFSNVNIHGIVSTSLMVIALISAATVGSALFKGLSLPVIAWVFVASAVIGMLAGRLLSPRVPARLLQMAFVAVCVVVAVIVLVKAHIA